MKKSLPVFFVCKVTNTPPLLYQLPYQEKGEAIKTVKWYNIVHCEWMLPVYPPLSLVLHGLQHKNECYQYTPHCLLFCMDYSTKTGPVSVVVLLVSTVTTQWKLKPTNQNTVLWYHESFEWGSKKHVNAVTLQTIILNSPILSDSDGESSFLDHTFN